METRCPLPSRPRLGLPPPTFRLLVLVVQDHVRGMVQAPRQVDQGAVSKLMDLEDTIIDVGDTVDVILKDIDAEGVTQAWGRTWRGLRPWSHSPGHWPHGSQAPPIQHVPNHVPQPLLPPVATSGTRPITPRLLGPGLTSAASPHICEVPTATSMQLNIHGCNE